MTSEIYDALLSAGASEEKARKAAETIAGLDTRFNRIDQDTVSTASHIDGRFSKVDERFSRVDAELLAIRTDVGLVKWIAVTNIGLTLALFARSFFN